MKQPETAAVLDAHADRLLTRIAPLLTGFDANSVAMIGAMLKMVAEDWDRAAAMLVEENRAIRALLRDAASFAGAHALADTTDDDLHLSALQRSNDALRAALVDLHALAETRDDMAALNDAIWAELRRSVERRRVGLANF